MSVRLLGNCFAFCFGIMVFHLNEAFVALLLRELEVHAPWCGGLRVSSIRSFNKPRFQNMDSNADLSVMAPEREGQCALNAFHTRPDTLECQSGYRCNPAPNQNSTGKQQYTTHKRCFLVYTSWKAGFLIGVGGSSFRVFRSFMESGTQASLAWILEAGSTPKRSASCHPRSS